MHIKFKRLITIAKVGKVLDDLGPYPKATDKKISAVKTGDAPNLKYTENITLKATKLYTRPVDLYSRWI